MKFVPPRSPCTDAARLGLHVVSHVLAKAFGLILVIIEISDFIGRLKNLFNPVELPYDIQASLIGPVLWEPFVKHLLFGRKVFVIGSLSV